MYVFTSHKTRMMKPSVGEDRVLLAWLV